jgi:hypothetical protein
MPHELAAIIAARDVEKNGGIARRQRMSRRLRSIGYIVWKLSLPRSGAKPERSIGAPAGCALSCGRHVLYALFNQTSCLYDGHNLRWIIRTNQAIAVLTPAWCICATRPSLQPKLLAASV